MALQQKRDMEMAHSEVENQAMTAMSELSKCKLKISQVRALLYCLLTLVVTCAANCGLV